MSNKATGKLAVINPTVQVTEKFSKREFVIETEDTYAQHVIFQLANDNTHKLDGLSIGDSVEVSFNLRGREWTNPQGEVKYFNTLEAWRVEKLGGASAPQAGTPAPSNGGDDDLPF